MPYIARTESLTDAALTGGLTDPRAQHQPSFGKKILCRDLTNFLSNVSNGSPLIPKPTQDRERLASASDDRLHNRISAVEETVNETTNGTVHHEANGHTDYTSNGMKKRPISGISKDVANGDHMVVDGETITDGLCPKRMTKQQTRDTPSRQPLSDLVPEFICSGGLSRSPAFDALPVVSHWGDRTSETSKEDVKATFRLSSTWGTAHVFGEGTDMYHTHGAPCWSLRSHSIGSAEAGASKFSQHYIAESDTLVTNVHLERRDDTPRTDGVIGAATMMSWGRNARVADAVDCATGLLSNASKLLDARDEMIKTGNTQYLSFAEVRPGVMPQWCAARKPLPPKLSGVAIAPDKATTDLLVSEGSEGPMLNTSIFSMAVGYNRGVYGGSISGLWAVMDSSFVLDYSIGKYNTAMGESLSSAFEDVAAAAKASTYAGPHITDIRIVKGCNYGCLRQKTMIEDSHLLPSRPCIVVWNDLAQLARYKLADAVFCHVYYDAGGGEQMAAIAGLGCVAHDWIDLGADVTCGEVSNIIPSLTRGSLEEEALAEVYSRLTGAMIWYRDNDPYNPAALCLLFTHWWQLANCRHRPITLLGRTDLDLNAAITATVPVERPSLEHFRMAGTPVSRGQQSLDRAEARLARLVSSKPLPEIQAVINLLVQPVFDYIKGGDSLPSESEYIAAVLAAEIAYPHGQKILELWDLAIVMWECGAMWAAGVAGLCYTHTGESNCDRARNDLADTTWT
ncbi:hypothetical protein VHEMI02226 [[Torrubiella] hemipterigena]|uniref:Uncharacterized protein n=1 Tax=[Torrubiella] hemipterigena TaxID=1531966 RepID=A0A0A1SVA8_9HYPO|nr:hypothetical protein VHEMI02226 [[Torrubiella] hemipterigena]